MKLELNEKRYAEVKYLLAECGVRYWEDAEVNGVEDESGSLIPCRKGETWSPVIELETGIIKDWPKGVVAEIHYKVCDDGRYSLLNDNMEEMYSLEGYVPSMMCPQDSGYGDYVIMSISGDGKIDGWSADLSYFTEDEE